MKLFRAFLTILCALILAGSATLWIRSSRHADVLAFRGPGGFLDGLAGDRGGVLLVVSRIPVDGEYAPPDSAGRENIHSVAWLPVPPDDFQTVHDALFSPSQKVSEFAGFQAARGTYALTTSSAPDFRAAMIPYWFLLLASAPLPLLEARRALRRWNRKRKGLCLHCGYDLRASAERCPECGEQITVSHSIVAASKESRPSGVAGAARDD